jgi:hypothetical protein
MAQDGKSIKTNIDATIDATTEDKNATIKQLVDIRQILWALLGFKMAVEKLRELKFKVEVVASPENDATIKIHFAQLKFDFDGCTINGKDIMVAIDELTKRIDENGGKNAKK